jgi:hypothetical protein
VQWWWWWLGVSVGPHKLEPGRGLHLGAMELQAEVQQTPFGGLATGNDCGLHGLPPVISFAPCSSLLWALLGWTNEVVLVAVRQVASTVPQVTCTSAGGVGGLGLSLQLGWPAGVEAAAATRVVLPDGTAALRRLTAASCCQACSFSFSL